MSAGELRRDRQVPPARGRAPRGFPGCHRVVVGRDRLTRASLRPLRRHRLLGGADADLEPEGAARPRGGSGIVAARVLPPPSRRKYWTRRGVAEWLAAKLAEDQATLVGIDHAFSFPVWYFQTHRLHFDWPIFLDDFQRHWPTDDDNTYVDFVRDGSVGDGAARLGDPRWRRLTEMRAGSAGS